jgi:NTP pyrophosphatase (non-canonical NTP hydrolase)
MTEPIHPNRAEAFLDAFKDIQMAVHSTAVSKGWWDPPEWTFHVDVVDGEVDCDEIRAKFLDRNDGELLALIHSEVSEALEALRHGNPPDDKIPLFSGAEAELADTIIRIMDLAERRNWNIAGAIIEKMRYNQGRERRHGKDF